MGFSKSGLIKQLVFEGFSSEVAENAVNSLAVDWGEQAVRKSNDYLNLTSFSKSGLTEQLKFEEFTSDEANYAVNSISVDWYDQAKKKADEIEEKKP